MSSLDDDLEKMMHWPIIGNTYKVKSLHFKKPLFWETDIYDLKDGDIIKIERIGNKRVQFSIIYGPTFEFIRETNTKKDFIWIQEFTIRCEAQIALLDAFEADILVSKELGKNPYCSRYYPQNSKEWAEDSCSSQYFPKNIFDLNRTKDKWIKAEQAIPGKWYIFREDVVKDLKNVKEKASTYSVDIERYNFSIPTEVLISSDLDLINQ